MVEPLYLYLIFTCFNPDMVSYLPLLLHAWNDLKYIFLDFVRIKWLPFTKKKSMASSIFYWCLTTRGGKGIFGMALWCSGLLLIALPCIMGTWGPYMAYALLMSSEVIGKFMIWFFWMASFKLCVDSHPTSCCNILVSSATLISRL